MIIIIDNYDSFTYNLVHYFQQIDEMVHVLQNDQTTIETIKAFNPDLIVLSPGPGKPSDSGISRDVLYHLGDKVPILGVCLGHQTIIEHFGGKVTKADKPVHGKISTITHDRQGVFTDIPQFASVTRYHSLQAVEKTLPDCLKVTARSEDGTIMGITHRSMPITGIQFHPESITTNEGFRMLENCYQQAKRWGNQMIGGSLHENSVSAL